MEDIKDQMLNVYNQILIAIVQLWVFIGQAVD